MKHRQCMVAALLLTSAASSAQSAPHRAAMKVADPVTMPIEYPLPKPGSAHFITRDRKHVEVCSDNSYGMYVRFIDPKKRADSNYYYVLPGTDVQEEEVAGAVYLVCIQLQ